MSILFECNGQDLIQRRLLRVGANASDATPAFAEIVDVMIDETKIQFATQGGHASDGWKPLKQATIHDKTRHGYPPEILQRTGDMLRSLTAKGDANMILRAGPDFLEFGSSLHYPGYHQTGTKPGPGRGHNLPRRAPLAFTETAKTAMVKILQRHCLVGTEV